MRPSQQFAARSKDDVALRRSSSGAIAYELSKYVVAHGGVVCGAVWTEDFTLEHQIVTSFEELHKLTGSKYLISRITDSLSSIELYLNEGFQVLFIGTPCQTAAVRKKFGYNERLILCAIFCHSNVPAPVWKSYLADLSSHMKSHVKSVSFRNKLGNWRSPKIRIEFSDFGKELVESLYENEYMEVFFSGWATQEACFSCKFRQGASSADLMIGDFWGSESVLPEWGDENGVSAVLIYSPIGSSIIKRLNVEMREVSYETILMQNPGLERSPVIPGTARQRFQITWRGKGFHRAYRYAKYGPWGREIFVRLAIWIRTKLGAIRRMVYPQ